LLPPPATRNLQEEGGGRDPFLCVPNHCPSRLPVGVREWPLTPSPPAVVSGRTHTSTSGRRVTWRGQQESFL
ncbi:hypothetical protein Pcinc_038806, partial [Petrolisthes cinctipes]